jgi:hypothetical protein
LKLLKEFSLIISHSVYRRAFEPSPRFSGPQESRLETLRVDTLYLPYYNESAYKEKISDLLEPEVYETLSKDSMAQIERKIRQLLIKQHKTVFPVALKRKLSPYHNKHPHLYGLPKIHKPDIPLRPIVSSIDSPCYAMSEFLHKILTPVVGNTDSFVNNTQHFIKSIKDFNLQNEDYLVSFDVVSLFTNVPVEEVLQVIKIDLVQILLSLNDLPCKLKM